jgi:hypothetical protein
MKDQTIVVRQPELLKAIREMAPLWWAMLFFFVMAGMRQCSAIDIGPRSKDQAPETGEVKG